MALIQQGAESILLEYWLILIGYDLAVDGYLWDKHPEHEAPVPLQYIPKMLYWAILVQWSKSWKIRL